MYGLSAKKNGRYGELAVSRDSTVCTSHFFIKLHNFKVQILDATFYAGSEHTTASFPFKFLFEIGRGALCIGTIRKCYVHLEN